MAMRYAGFRLVYISNLIPNEVPSLETSSDSCISHKSTVILLSCLPTLAMDVQDYMLYV
jgi:hypothetical protein